MTRLHHLVSLFTVILLIAGPSSAYAIDCRHAATAVEHLICRHKNLQNADAAMGQAYTSILESAGNDTEIRAMLVQSQKRWLHARDERFDGPMDYPGAPDEDAIPANLLRAIRDRTKELSEPSRTDPALPRLIAIALAQRKFLSQYSGGPFAGFNTDCDFVPGGGELSYACFASRSYQNRERVCTYEDAWASGSVYQNRSVANVVQGQLQVVAVCGDSSSSGSHCPAPENRSDQDAHWNWHPDLTNLESVPVKGLPKLDAEAEPSADDDTSQTGWLHACLTDSRYPASEPH